MTNTEERTKIDAAYEAYEEAHEIAAYEEEGAIAEASINLDNELDEFCNLMSRSLERFRDARTKSANPLGRTHVGNVEAIRAAITGIEEAMGAWAERMQEAIGEYEEAVETANKAYEHRRELAWNAYPH